MKNYFKNLDMDKILTALSVIYIVVPVIIFLMFWTKIWIGLIGSAFIVYGARNVIKELNENDDVKIIVKNNVVLIVVISLVVLAYVLFSGIGGIGAQFDDYFVRNPIFYDLNHMRWPLVYNFAPNNKLSHIFNGEYLFVYYLTYWLPVSLIVKVFNLSMNTANIFLMIYALFGLLLIIFNICKYLKVVKYVVLIFLFFSGMDVVGGFIKWMLDWFLYNGFDAGVFFDLCKDFWDGLWNKMYFLAYRNLELTYEDVLLSIFNTFNQSIPTYLILSVFLRMKTNKYIAYLLSIIFAYSPWAMIGSMLYLMVGSFKKNQKIVNIFNIVNVIVPIAILVVFGSYYVASTMVNSEHELLLFYNNKLFIMSILSIIFEWLVYMILIFDNRKKCDYYMTTFFNLLIFDLFYIGNRNLNLRASMPGIFFLSLYLIQYFVDNNKVKYNNIKKVILICCLFLSFVTPLSNIIYGVQMIKNHKNITNPIKSFQSPSLYTEAYLNDYYFNVVKMQFFSKDYKNSLYYKYIMKR